MSYRPQTLEEKYAQHIILSTASGAVHKSIESYKVLLRENEIVNNPTLAVVNTEPKRCAKCKVRKELKYFGLNKAAFDGLNSKCLLCVSAYHKAKYKSKKEKAKLS